MYWAWNITDLGHKEGEGFGKGVTHTHPIFLGVPPLGNYQYYGAFLRGDQDQDQ